MWSHKLVLRNQIFLLQTFYNGTSRNLWWSKPFCCKHFTFQCLVVATFQKNTNCSDFRLIRGCVLLICDSDRTSSRTIGRFCPTELMIQSIKHLGKVLGCVQNLLLQELIFSVSNWCWRQQLCSISDLLMTSPFISSSEKTWHHPWVLQRKVRSPLERSPRAASRRGRCPWPPHWSTRVIIRGSSWSGCLPGLTAAAGCFPVPFPYSAILHHWSALFGVSHS